MTWHAADLPQGDVRLNFENDSYQPGDSSSRN
jgi:hypothetical protein